MATKRRKEVGVVARGRTAILLIALLAAPGVAAAASPEAPQIGAAELVVSLVRGRLGQITRELAIQDNVYSEEVVETDADAATRIVFVDGTELSMGPSSRMVLDRYVYDPNTGAGEMAMQMVTGVFQFASGSIPSDGYDIGTPFGNLAIRGTEFFVDIEPARRGLFKFEEGQGIIAGTTITSDDNCVYLPVPGTGDAQVLGPNDCQQELRNVEQMVTLLEGPAPAAGPVPAEFPGGSASAERNERSPGFGPSGGSTQ